MPRKSVKNYCEPWMARVTRQVPVKPNLDGLEPETIDALMGTYHRALDNARWIVWGTRVHEPHITHPIDPRTPAVFDEGDGILVELYPFHHLPEGAPTHVEFATRIAEAVTALAGIADPHAFIEDTRRLLRSLLTEGATVDPREDPRIVSLLARCIPPAEQGREAHPDDVG